MSVFMGTSLSSLRWRRQNGLVLLLVGLAWCGTPPPAEAQINWRALEASTLPAMNSAEIVERIRDRILAAGGTHMVVQFSEPVDRDVREGMKQAGVELLSYLGDHAFFAAVAPEAFDAGALGQVSSLRGIQPIERDFKLHPMLAEGTVPDWAVVGRTPPDVMGATEEIVGAYVIFHPDVALDTVGVQACLHHGAVIRDVVHSINTLVVELPYSEITELALDDSVQWIEPPLPRMSGLNNSNRVITEADDVQAAPYNLDGSGVTVLVYDAGYAWDGHPDFGGRLTVRDTAGLSDHATHVSGTVGGSGAESGGTYHGMAPAVIIESYGFDYDGSGIFLYSNPGDIENDYDEAINLRGVDISNNSIGTNTATNGFPCNITGNYGATAMLIDTIVRGDGSNPAFASPFRIVWANGNERQTTRCGDTYATTAPPACAKNHITVGALNSNNDSMTGFSSWGPTDDGRLKPDIAAPGCQSIGDNGVTSCSSSGGYNVKCGTSMASPTVCGLSSLLIQDFRAQFAGQPMFRNSTLKAWLAHTAEDLGSPGPDYKFGFGSVRIKRAIDFMRTASFYEGSLTQNGSFVRNVTIESGDPELKVTLAWDDAPATPNVGTALINDLDLRVYSPIALRQYPWTLDPASPISAATRDQEDHVNNIEQVLVENPMPGTWMIEVYGQNVPNGPQSFSLVGDGASYVWTSIRFPNGLPELLPPQTPVVIDVEIIAYEETLIPGSPTLFYRGDGGTFQTTPLTHVGGDLYQATITAGGCNYVPEYFFRAEGSISGVVFLPAGAPNDLFAAPVGAPIGFFTEDFDAGAGTFSYQDDTFRGTSNPANADGTYEPTGGQSGGGVRVEVGGNSTDMSGGWVSTFDVTGSPASVELEISYRLLCSGGYESDEYGEALLSIDGTLIGVPPNDYLHRFVGDGATNWDSGWLTETFSLSLADGTHQIIVGAFNNKSSTAGEITEGFFDNITVSTIDCPTFDITPPTPNPMAFGSFPAPDSPSAITMSAVPGTDFTPPVEYYFFYSEGAGAGGDSSGWQTPETYTDTGLDANMLYTYYVRARDSVPPWPNYTVYSPAAATATHIETPAGLTFGAITVDSIELLAAGTLSNLTTDLSGVYFDAPTPGGNGGINEWIQTPVDTATGLTPNTPYDFQVKARNRLGAETPYTAIETKATLADVPGAPSLSNATSTTLDLDVDPNGNPAGTDFAVICTATSPLDGNWDGMYVDSAGQPFAAEVWQSDGAWAVTTLQGLQPDTQYAFAVKARNLDSLETAFGPTASLTTGSIPVGACCFGDGSCTIGTQGDCNTAGGAYEGDATACTPNPCPQPCPLLGDVNGDGFLTGDDVAGFVRVKLGTPGAGDVETCADFGTGTLEGDTTAFVAALLVP